MSYFKKFTDIGLGAVIFAASLYLLRQYMSFKPKTTEQYFVGMGGNAAETGVAPGKIEQFLEKDHRMLLGLIALLVLSLVISIVFRKLPYVSFAVSVVPLMEVAYLFQKDMLFEQELLFIVGTALHCLGILVDAIFLDKEDGKHRLWLATLCGSAVSALACLAAYLSRFITPRLETVEGFISKVTKLPLETVEKLEKFIFTPLQDIYVSGIEERELKFLLVLMGIFAAFFLICLLTRNVYYLNAFLSLVPLCATVYFVYTERLKVTAFAMLASGIIVVAANILLMVFENNLSYKEQQALKKKEEEPPYNPFE